MANTKIETKIELHVRVTVELTIPEARALNEMVKYGVKPFLEGYYKHLGKSYMQPHEKGVTSLFETVKEDLAPKLYKLDSLIKRVTALEEDIKVEK